MKLVWLPQAQRLRFQQLDYIATRNSFAAVRMDTEIGQQAGHLQEHPHMGREGGIKGTRERIIRRTPFILVYRVCSELPRGEVLRVLHGAQQWPPAVGG